MQHLSDVDSVDTLQNGDSNYGDANNLTYLNGNLVDDFNVSSDPGQVPTWDGSHMT